MSFSPPPANASGGYTLIWLNSKFIFIVHHLPKIQEEEYKAYSLALSLCFSTHDRANAQDFYSAPYKSSKQWVHHRCSLASIRQLEELVSHHWDSYILAYNTAFTDTYFESAYILSCYNIILFRPMVSHHIAFCELMYYKYYPINMVRTAPIILVR